MNFGIDTSWVVTYIPCKKTSMILGWINLHWLPIYPVRTALIGVVLQVSQVLVLRKKKFFKLLISAIHQGLSFLENIYLELLPTYLVRTAIFGERIKLFWIISFGFKGITIFKITDFLRFSVDVYDFWNIFFTNIPCRNHCNVLKLLILAEN